MPPRSASLSVSVVTYRPDLGLLAGELRSLASEVCRARAEGRVGQVSFTLVDNGPGQNWTRALQQLVDEMLAPLVACVLLSGQGNLGYGRGHNLAIRRSGADYHLVLNPDVILAGGALGEALCYLESHPQVALLAPQVRDAQGKIQFLCKRYPSVLDLALRGFAPAALRNLFRDRLHRYEMRDVLGEGPVEGIPLASGSFMLCRRAELQSVGGFSDAFFLYFEDFDLSMRLSATARLDYVPAVKIVHHGGDAGAKGPRHWFMFLRSATLFFRRHGWKWR